MPRRGALKVRSSANTAQVGGHCQVWLNGLLLLFALLIANPASKLENEIFFFPSIDFLVFSTWQTPRFPLTFHCRGYLRKAQ